MPEQERFVERMVEQSVDNHVHWSWKEFVLELPFEVCKFPHQDRISQRTVDECDITLKRTLFQVKIAF